MDNKITKIIAEEIKDSRGNPTIKVTVYANDKFDSFSVPSGASTGTNEAHELRDPDGKGVRKAIENINNIIAPALIDQNVLDQEEIDRAMIKLDGTKNKDNLGANAMIGTSIACAKVAAKVSSLEIFEYLRELKEIKPSLRLDSGQARKVPYLYMNLFEGGKHTNNILAFQEYHIVPDIDYVNEAVEIGIKIQNTLKEMIMKELGKESVILGDEGGFAPQISDIRKPLEYLSRAIKENGLKGKVRLALDVAALFL